MAMKRFISFFAILIFTACVEPYEFVIKNSVPSLVIEATISDKSYQETLLYPSDGRYFATKLSRTTDVTNVPAEPVSYATVQLISDGGEAWEYIESEISPGTYELRDDHFKAVPGVSYKLRVQLSDEEMYESAWEALPDINAPPMGSVDFEEITFKKYEVQANKEEIVTVDGVQIFLNLPENLTGEPLYYRWSVIPHWMYIAPLSPSIVLPGHTCWVTTPYYIRNYELQEDYVGGYKKHIFRMETVRNERIFEKFSALIVQQTMSKPYFNFWTEMKEQSAEDQVRDKPPYNLLTNFHGDEGKVVLGYFAVTHEQATRWWFSMKDLSYAIRNTLREDCLQSFGGPPAPSCVDCRQYVHGNSTNVRPAWWVK